MSQVRDIVSAWLGRYNDPEFLKAFERATDEAKNRIFAQMANELKLVASKSVAIIEVVS